MCFDYIRKFYRVPIRRGGVVYYEGQRGFVTGSRGPHVRARLEGDPIVRLFHPLELVWADSQTGAQSQPDRSVGGEV